MSTVNGATPILDSPLEAPSKSPPPHAQPGRVALTLRQAVEARVGLDDLIARPLPPATAFAVARLTRQIRDALADFDAARNPLLERLGTPDPDKPGVFHFKPDALKEFNRLNDELMDQAIDLPEVKVRLADLGTIAPATLLAVEWLIEDDEPELATT